MTVRINMADADFEPSDEDLVRLMREAFANVRAANDVALARFWEEIAIARERAEELAAQAGHGPTPST